MNQSPAVFRFSLARLLLLTGLIGIWLAGLRTLPAPWAVWLTTAVFYVGVLLCHSRETE
jgi:hypothetical protein